MDDPVFAEGGLIITPTTVRIGSQTVSVRAISSLEIEAPGGIAMGGCFMAAFCLVAVICTLALGPLGWILAALFAVGLIRGVKVVLRGTQGQHFLVAKVGDEEIALFASKDTAKLREIMAIIEKLMT